MEGFLDELLFTPFYKLNFIHRSSSLKVLTVFRVEMLQRESSSIATVTIQPKLVLIVRV